MKTRQVIQLSSWKMIHFCKFVSPQLAGNYCADSDTFFILLSSTSFDFENRLEN